MDKLEEKVERADKILAENGFSHGIVAARALLDAARGMFQDKYPEAMFQSWNKQGFYESLPKVALTAKGSIVDLRRAAFKELGKEPSDAEIIDTCTQEYARNFATEMMLEKLKAGDVEGAKAVVEKILPGTQVVITKVDLNPAKKPRTSAPSLN